MGIKNQHRFGQLRAKKTSPRQLPTSRYFNIRHIVLLICGYEIITTINHDPQHYYPHAMPLSWTQFRTCIHRTDSSTPIPGKKKIDFGCSESDAEIFVNGKLLGKGSMELIVPSKDCITVIGKENGLLIGENRILQQKETCLRPPKSYYLELRPDDAYNASVQTDIANVDIELVCNNTNKDKAWRLINQIVLSHFDVIEMTDKETGYMYVRHGLYSPSFKTLYGRV